MNNKTTPEAPTVNHILQSDGHVLHKLLAKVAQLRQFNTLLSQCMENRLANNITAANYENQILTVVTHSAIWATQFRFQLPEILQKLKQFEEFKELKTIQSKIIPQSAKQKKPSQAVARLSTETASQVLEAAKTIQHDKLRGIMEKIATRSQENS